MLEKDFVLKKGFTDLSSLKNCDFIKKTGEKCVFRFVSTKEEQMLQFSHEKGKSFEEKNGKSNTKKMMLKGNSLVKENRDLTDQNWGEKTTKNSDKTSPKNGLETQKFSFKKKIILLLSGAFIGLLNGFFGGGGGMVCVPILEKVLSLDSKHSHATAIAVIFPLSLISACIYVANGYIQTLPLLTVGLGVVTGGILGAFALKFLPPKVVQILFAIVMFAGGIKLIL